MFQNLLYEKFGEIGSTFDCGRVAAGSSRPRKKCAASKTGRSDALPPVGHLWRCVSWGQIQLSALIMEIKIIFTDLSRATSVVSSNSGQYLRA